MTQKFKEGDRVNYHQLIGGPLTSIGHEIIEIELMPNNFGCAVAWITRKTGCVALDSLSVMDYSKPLKGYIQKGKVK